MFIFDDGRHLAGLYQFQPPLAPADVTLNVDQLVDSGVDTLIYIAGLVGGSVLYDSRVAQKIGDNVERWVHPVYYRTARNVQQLVADGHDPLKLLCDRAHEKGIWFLASAPSTVTGGIREPFVWEGGNSDFAFDHPEFQVGPDEDPRAEHTDPTRFNFLRAEVRENRFRLFEELLADYETDGVALNLFDLVPLCKFGEADQLAPVLTDWIARLRAVAAKAETVQGRRKRIYAQLPAHPDAWKMLGLDVPQWVANGLVDGLVCQPGLLQGPMDQDIDLSAVNELVSGTECRVLVGVSTSVGRQLSKAASPPMLWAAAANAYAQGADGFGFAGAGWLGRGWPWRGDEYGTLRPLAHPELLATADKLYRAHSAPSPPPGLSRHPQEGPTDWVPGVRPALPLTLAEGEPVEVRLQVSDDISHWHGQGNLESVRLRVRISGLEAELNEVRIELNGRALPDSVLRLNDLTYRYLESGVVSPYGFVYDYDLTPEHYPRPGRNLVTVTLVKRDPNIEPPFQVWDVDCVIRYRAHRSFEREPIDY